MNEISFLRYICFAQKEKGNKIFKASLTAIYGFRVLSWEKVILMFEWKLRRSLHVLLVRKDFILLHIAHYMENCLKMVQI